MENPHEKRLQGVSWHPLAENLLLTHAVDKLVWLFTFFLENSNSSLFNDSFLEGSPLSFFHQFSIVSLPFVWWETNLDQDLGRRAWNDGKAYSSCSWRLRHFFDLGLHCLSSGFNCKRQVSQNYWSSGLHCCLRTIPLCLLPLLAFCPLS